MYWKVFKPEIQKIKVLCPGFFSLQFDLQQ